MARRRRSPWLVVLASCALAAGALGLPLTGGTPAEAAVPPPAAGSAVVSLAVGDARSGPSAVTPLPGAVFGLFATDPSGTADPTTGFVTATPLFTCTSDADGDCSVQVPIGTGAGQLGQNSRLWAAPIGAPPGYYANPQWQTAPLTGGATAVLPVVFQTPPLVAGQTYRSGSTWMTAPGLQTSPANSTSEYTRRIASNGVWNLSRANPPLPTQCGLNVALVVDLSSSVAGSVPQLKQAMDAFVDALRGTPSQAALVTFGSDSPANGFTSSGLQSVATNTDAAAFRSRYAGWGNPPTNYTNWDRGLAAAAAVGSPTLGAPDHVDLTVFLTDGNPTVSGPSPVTGSNQLVDPNSGFTRFKELNDGLASANLVKSQDTRVLAVGVGAGVSSAGSAANLRTVSGPTAYDGTNIGTADYVQTTDYASAGQSLRNLVLAGCAPSISVIKRIVPFDWQEGGPAPIDTVAYTPPAPWEFTATGATVNPPATKQTELATGATSFDLTIDPAQSPSTFSIAETAQAAYTSLPAQTVCVNKATGVDVPVPTTTDSATQFSLPVGVQDIVSCVVYNRAPDFTQASIIVHKRWRITTWNQVVDLANGDQPPELRAALTLTGPSDPAPIDQGWEVPRAGYSAPTTVDVGETVNNARIPGCTLTASTLETGPPDATTPGSGTAFTGSSTAAVVAGPNEWTITNAVTCVSLLTLQKTVASGDATPGVWLLDAVGPAGAPAGPSGASGTPEATRVEVAPEQTYQLTESVRPGSAADALHYRQTDLRTRPLLFPQSSGSWTCSIDGVGPRLLSGGGIEGAVTVPLGQAVTCAAENNIATLTLIKEVQGGTAVASDFTFSLDPLDRGAEDAGGIDVVAGPPPVGTSVEIAPLRHYRLTESGGPPGYELTSLTCQSGIRDFLPADVFAEPGGSVTCIAVNSFTEWTLGKTSDPPSGSTVQPGDVITYTVSAEQVGGVPTSDVTITDDLTNVHTRARQHHRRSRHRLLRGAESDLDDSLARRGRDAHVPGACEQRSLERGAAQCRHGGGPWRPAARPVRPVDPRLPNNGRDHSA